MKASFAFLSTLLLATPILADQLLDQDFIYAAQCGKKNPAVNAAITTFCNKYTASGQYSDTIMCPGERSSRGMARNGFRAKITGNCNPPQWIPGKYCLLQFHQMCAEGDAQGLGTRTFGTNGCQTWTLEKAGLGLGEVASGLAFGQ